MADLVSVQTFRYRHEADLARSILEAHGIQAIVMGDNCGGIEPYLDVGLGGIRLLVLREEAAEALLLLRADFPIPADAPDPSPEALPIPASEPRRIVPKRRGSRSGKPTCE
jgi:hypothetical protein